MCLQIRTDASLPGPIWEYTVERVCCVIDFLVQDQWLLQMCLKVVALLEKSLVDLPGRAPAWIPERIVTP